MGRWVSNDFEWKFAFGDQSSSFGEILEKLSSNCKELYVNRYIGTKGEGEQLEMSIESNNGWKNFKKNAKEFIGKGFKIKSLTKWCKCKEKFGDEYWDKLMIRKFVKQFDKQEFNGDTFYFEVEY